MPNRAACVSVYILPTFATYNYSIKGEKRTSKGHILDFQKANTIGVKMEFATTA